MNLNQQILNALSLYFSEPHIKEVVHLEEGVENDCFYVEFNKTKIVIRFYGTKHAYIGKRDDSDIEFEIQLMQYYHSHGIPVPMIYKSLKNKFTETLGRRKFIIMEYIDGTSPMEYSDKQISSVAKLMARMHNLAKNFSYLKDVIYSS